MYRIVPVKILSMEFFFHRCRRMHAVIAMNPAATESGEYAPAMSDDAKKILSVVFSRRHEMHRTAIAMAGMYLPANLKKTGGSFFIKSMKGRSLRRNMRIPVTAAARKASCNVSLI